MSKVKQRKQKAKKIKKTNKRSSKYVFSLSKIQQQDNFVPIEVDFSEFLCESESLIKRNYPFYLKDNQPFTPSFVYPLLGYYNPQSFMGITDQGFQQGQKQQKQVSITRPEPDPNYRVCGVCRCYYDDYFMHIGSELHASHIKNSIYQKYIKNYCQKHYKTAQFNQKKSVKLKEDQIQSTYIFIQ